MLSCKSDHKIILNLFICYQLCQLLSPPCYDYNQCIPCLITYIIFMYPLQCHHILCYGCSIGYFPPNITGPSLIAVGASEVEQQYSAVTKDGENVAITLRVCTWNIILFTFACLFVLFCLFVCLFCLFCLLVCLLVCLFILESYT